MLLLKWYRQPGLGGESEHAALWEKLASVVGPQLSSLRTELCFYVQLEDGAAELGVDKVKRLVWLLNTPFEDELSEASFLEEGLTESGDLLVEIGPRLHFSTPFSTNAVAVCQSVGLTSVTRLEVATRYRIGGATCSSAAVVATLHDRMTQCRYERPLTSLSTRGRCGGDAVFSIDVIGRGRSALLEANATLGLGFDDWDIDYYTQLFREKIKRNPTSVECFDLAQSNSEHSRHWFFKGRLVVDGEERPTSLFDDIMATQQHSNNNNVIKFNDNSSCIEGFPVVSLCPEKPTEASFFKQTERETRHIVFTAETHNFPTGVAPFPGATTGTGGRIRDVQSTGRGANVIAGTAGYCVGSLHIPGYVLPWETPRGAHPASFATPLHILTAASDGASDYGNKFGEPLVCGFVRSASLVVAGGARREWLKPVMFSGGIGSLDARHVAKEPPQIGMRVVKVGGPVYRIGVGGGAASSVEVQGDNAAERDFAAVQRGDAEMGQKMNRVVRAAVEMGARNPICSIHDQGAGGNGNVLKEICEPAGALIHAGAFRLGDPTLSLLELWGAEYQESNALLVRPRDVALLRAIGEREKCDVTFVGDITGNGKIQLEDDRDVDFEHAGAAKRNKAELKYPVDLDLEHVLGSMPRKVFCLEGSASRLQPLSLPSSLTVIDALHLVLRLPAVASKRYLTNKVDRSVTGLVAQQQCVGPLHTPLADVAVIALSYADTVGGATAIGEQPIKGLVDAGCGARMSVGEALTNLVFAQITCLRDVKCSGNWMWPAKLPHQGALLVAACDAMCDVMRRLGVAVDGGKDSLSMAARVGEATVAAPGTIVVSAYAGCPDITATVTPDLECPSGSGVLLYVPLCPGKHRLGGSALAQCHGQIGDTTPDLDDPDLFTRVFSLTQGCIKDRLLTAGHDVSDGGLVGCVLEMAFAGNCGLTVDIPASPEADDIHVLFAEELGLVFEVDPTNQEKVINRFENEAVTCHLIGRSQLNTEISVSVRGVELLRGATADLRDVWEETSFELERRQCAADCVAQERRWLRDGAAPPQYRFPPPGAAGVPRPVVSVTPLVAVVREEGSNGDREMAAAFHRAGFQVWDVNGHDLCGGALSLDRFRGVAFVGGFSYADVLGSAKGWASSLKHDGRVAAQLRRFYERDDTFSLGVCNGCQLMALLGWVAGDHVADAADGCLTQNVHLAKNLSGRFESRFCTVRVESSNSLMLRGLAGAVLGVWVAHGEGRMVFRNQSIEADILANNLAPLRYVDPSTSLPTTAYPANPNGSVAGVAGLCSRDGRHLALMPHPERCVLPWQWPYAPWRRTTEADTSPWQRLFDNAYDWCILQDT